jgi:hypothetical protein
MQSLDPSTEDLTQKLKPLIAKSYIDELGNIKAGMAESCPGLEELFDMDALEAGKWHFKDDAWPLLDEKTVGDVCVMLSQSHATRYRDIHQTA